MKVLVTGGAGFIGHRLVQALLQAGHHVRLITRKEHAAEAFLAHDGSLEAIRLDLLRFKESDTDVFAGCDVVFNCAGEVRDESLMQALHVDATSRLIEACRSVALSEGRGIHWVQLSSVGAYGPVTGQANRQRTVTEHSQLNPVGEYERTKTEADRSVEDAAEPGVFSYCILRPSNVYGAGMPNDSIRQWGRMIQKRLFFYVGDADSVATYVHVDDVVEALLLCGFDERARNRIYNISNDCYQTEVVEGIAAAVGAAPPRVRLPESWLRAVSTVFASIHRFPVTSSRVDALVARTRYPVDKLRTELGFSPSRSVPETISEVFEK